MIVSILYCHSLFIMICAIVVMT